MASFIKPHSRWSQFWRAYLFIGALVLVAISLFYTLGLIKRLEAEPRIMSRVFARFCMTATVPEPSGDSPETGIIFEEVIQNINFPVVVTDHHGVPISWRGIDFNQTIVPDEVAGKWDSLDVQDTFYKLKRIVSELDRQNVPISMPLDPDSANVVQVHYGQPRILKELKYVPLIQTAIIALFVWIGFIGFRNIKHNEERAVWVGLAKEAAHQLGTPISSLMGWLALLKDKTRTLDEVVPEMENDIDHLNRVLARFNQIGSVPKLELSDAGEVCARAVRYYQYRAANMGKQITFVESYCSDCQVPLNPELFLWAIENLIKNAIDAIEKTPGRISIGTRINGKQFEVLIEDNGKGISSQDQKKIFRPGFTTKAVGWGLGLSLVRRIIEDYHRGRVRLLYSRPGNGSGFVVNLPLTGGK
jgi:NtrC-family two-component system sensor histidine kinase KinB